MAELTPKQAAELVRLGQLKTTVDQVKLYVTGAEDKIKVTNTHFTIPTGKTYATVKDALAQLVTEQSEASLEVQEIAGQTTDAFAKRYKLWTGVIDKTKTGDERYTSATLLGTIDIPKDMVVESGAVITLTAEEAKAKTGDADAKAGKYIELTIANKASSKLYVYVGDLVDIYIGYESDSIKTEITSTDKGQAVKATAVLSDKAGNLLSVLAKHESTGEGDVAYTAGLYVDGANVTKSVTAVNSLPLNDTTGAVEYATDDEITALFA